MIVQTPRSKLEDPLQDQHKISISTGSADPRFQGQKGKDFDNAGRWRMFSHRLLLGDLKRS